MSKFVQSAKANWRRVVGSGLAVAALVAAPLPAAAYDVAISPAFQTVNLGQQVTVDVRVADVLPDGLGSYQFRIDFDDSILSFSSANDGAALGDSVGLAVTPFGGSLELSDFSFDDVATLIAGQSNDMTLFTLVFNSVGVGTSGLNFLFQELTDASSAQVAFATLGASVTVQQPGGGGGGNDVPEPASLALATVGLLVGAAARRKARNSH